MRDWIKQIDVPTIAMVVGPLLMLVGLIAYRNQFWGPVLDDLRVAVKQTVRNQEQMMATQREILDAVRCR